jgi:hypothetical protein
MNNYSFSDISFKNLDECVDIEQDDKLTKYEKEWFDYREQLSQSDIEFLDSRIAKLSLFIRSYSELQLLSDFISLILDRVDFYFINSEHKNQTIRPFLDENLKYSNEKLGFTFSGRFDFAVARGFNYPKTPYFFIQEFKKSKEAKDPEPQLLAEMISAVEINQTDKIRGAFIIGQNWTFVTLHKIANSSYKYYFSKQYNSIDLDDLQVIFSMLLFVKKEIVNISKYKD